MSTWQWFLWQSSVLVIRCFGFLLPRHIMVGCTCCFFEIRYDHVACFADKAQEVTCVTSVWRFKRQCIILHISSSVTKGLWKYFLKHRRPQPSVLMKDLRYSPPKNQTPDFHWMQKQERFIRACPGSQGHSTTRSARFGSVSKRAPICFGCALL